MGARVNRRVKRRRWICTRPGLPDLICYSHARPAALRVGFAPVCVLYWRRAGYYHVGRNEVVRRRGEKIVMVDGRAAPGA